MRDENTKNKRKKRWLFFVAAGIAVVLFIIGAAKTAFSASPEEQKEVWMEGTYSLYQEQIKAFQVSPDTTLEHSITLELGKIGRNLLQPFIKEDVSKTNLIHIGIQQTIQNEVEKKELQISIDGEQTQNDVFYSNDIKDTVNEVSSIISFTAWKEVGPFLKKALQAIESQNGIASDADIFVNDNGDTVTKTLQYDTYTVVLKTRTKGKTIELELNIASVLPEFADVVCHVKGTGTITKQKLSGTFDLQFSDSSITFDIEELDLKKLQNGYIKGTFVILPQESIMQQATILNKWVDFDISKTEWVFSMNSDKGKRRIKLTAFLPEELIFAYSIVTEVKE